MLSERRWKKLPEGLPMNVMRRNDVIRKDYCFVTKKSTYSYCSLFIVH